VSNPAASAIVVNVRKFIAFPPVIAALTGCLATILHFHLCGKQPFLRLQSTVLCVKGSRSTEDAKISNHRVALGPEFQDNAEALAKTNGLSLREQG
jgi:hypothetical protein